MGMLEMGVVLDVLGEWMVGLGNGVCVGMLESFFRGEILLVDCEYQGIAPVVIDQYTYHA